MGAIDYFAGRNLFQEGGQRVSAHHFKGQFSLVCHSPCSSPTRNILICLSPILPPLSFAVMDKDDATVRVLDTLFVGWQQQNGTDCVDFSTRVSTDQ